MEWLLGSGAVAGIAGVVALGIYLAKMAGDNRSDLHALVQSGKDLANARRDNDGYKRNIEERDIAIEALSKKLARERAATDAAKEALGAAAKKLASRGDAASVTVDLNGAFARLSEMSTMPGTETGEGGDS